LSAALGSPLEAQQKAGQRQPVLLVFCCTIVGAAAQVLMKTGAQNLDKLTLLGMLANLPLMGGFCLYGLSALLLVLALRDGELSLLYPVIALTYVWVAILSFVMFHEHINPWRQFGIALIVIGVAVLGRRGRR
jgi:drug/metabolite transporter (DMT)-like permease